MGRRLSTGLILIRVGVLLAAFVPGAMNGWLLYYLHVNKLGPSDLMLVLELLVAAIFVHSLCCLLITHTGGRSKGTVWMVASVCFDVVFMFADVTVISLLSYTGLPLNCAGLTAPLWSTRNKRDLPSPGYSTVGFSDEQDGSKGALDRFCDMERTFFFCAVLSILAYALAMILGVFRICDLNYTRNSQVQDMLDEREQLVKLEFKEQEPELRPQPQAPGPDSDPSEHQRDEEAAMYASMTRPTMASSSSSSPMPSSSRYMAANLASVPESSSHHHAYTSVPSGVPGSLLPMGNAESNLDSSEITANMAMISDGSRPYNGHSPVDSGQLPAYSPPAGNQGAMRGHGNEDNDTRLSDYVKGETRAQDMKDAGNFH